MIQISSNDIRLDKREFDIIQKINEIVMSHFKNISLKKNEIKVYFLEEEEYYNYLGFEKPYKNLIVTDGFYDKTYQEIYIRLTSKSIVRTYVHEMGHFIDYNLNKHLTGIKVGSAFTRKIFDDLEFEDQLLNDLKGMPAYGLLSLIAGSKYILSADEIFARLFEVFIWEKLGRKYFTPDFYIKVPRLFIYLHSWLAENPHSRYFRRIQNIHLFLLKRSIDKRKVHDPYKYDLFSKYVVDFLT